tara:strand:+ start:378 stop:1439 length:1062 start_codon:yes stop_codon:yes gene_type:complete
MVSNVILKDLPTLYRNFLPDFFQKRIPEEQFATCNNCSMVCKGKDISKLSDKPFNEKYKCCTYHPSLPNYLIGGALIDQSQKGRHLLKSKIKEKVAVTPFGLPAPGDYLALYDKKSGAFGNSRKLLCPYFLEDSGQCGIWQYRESVCSTYFCKTVAGAKGKMFWEALNSYLRYIQNCLVEYTVIKAGLDITFISEFTRSLKAVTPSTLDKLPIPDDDYQALWENWAGREEEFFVWAYNEVSDLSMHDFQKIVGVREEVLLKGLVKSRSSMIDIPERLETRLEWQPRVDSPTQNINFKSIDTNFDMPSKVLKAFDGKRTTTEIIKTLDSEEDIELDPDFVLTLYHYDILKPSDA